MTTEQVCKALLPAILPTAKPFTVTAAVLEQENSTAWLANSCHLPKRCNRIWEGAYGKGRNYSVKPLIGKRKSRRVRQRKRNVHGQFCGALHGYIQHFSADIHGDNPTTARIIGKVFSCSHRNFEDFSRCALQHPPSKFSNSKDIGDFLDKIVPTRKAVVLF